MTVATSTIGHTYGVKVQRVQRVVVAADAASFIKKGRGSTAVSG